MIRRALPIVLSMSLACTSKETIAPGARMALARTTTGDFLRVPTESGGTIEFGPNATLRFGDKEVYASDVYLTEWGLIDKKGDPIASWDETRFAKIEQVDGAATVAVSATAAIAIVAIAALLKSGGNFNPGSGSKGGGGGGGSKGGGGGGGSAPVARSAPNPSPIIPDPAVTEVAFRTIEAVAASAQPNPSFTVRTDEEPDASTAIPMFSRGARRRAIVRAVGRLEGGACWPSSSLGDCVLSGARIGVRLYDMLELTGGVRVESSSTVSKPFAVFGGMLHGELPAAHWFALGLGASVAFDDVRARVIPQFGVRLRPVRGFWLGLYPIMPVYSSDTGGWTITSGGEITGEL